LINLVIGNAKNKKKSAQRRTKQTADTFSTEGKMKKTSSKQGQDFRKTLEEYRKQLESEFGVKPEKKPQQEPIIQKPAQKRPEPIRPRTIESPKTVDAILAEGVEEPLIDDGPKTEYSSYRLGLKPREDIIKAVVYSEILSKPKAYANKD
jgi:hypothetical protein